MTKLHALQGDITKLKVDAIVNAANSSLLGGGGVDGAIHRAAGPELVDECRLLGGCKAGQAKVTKGLQDLPLCISFTLSALCGVVAARASQSSSHACYRNALLIAREKDLRSIAFPSISTGIFGYPIEQAAKIAVATVRDVLQSPGSLTEIVFCCFSRADLEIYEAILTGHEAA